MVPLGWGGGSTLPLPFLRGHLAGIQADAKTCSGLDLLKGWSNGIGEFCYAGIFAAAKMGHPIVVAWSDVGHSAKPQIPTG